MKTADTDGAAKETDQSSNSIETAESSCQISNEEDLLPRRYAYK